MWGSSAAWAISRTLQRTTSRMEMMPTIWSSAMTLERIVVAVDPPASADGDACGILVCAVDHQHPPFFHVLADCSVSGLRPEGWARAVAIAAWTWGADRVIAEKNQGGEMVEAVLRGADSLLPVQASSGGFTAIGIVRLPMFRA